MDKTKIICVLLVFLLGFACFGQEITIKYNFYTQWDKEFPKEILVKNNKDVTVSIVERTYVEGNKNGLDDVRSNIETTFFSQKDVIIYNETCKGTVFNVSEKRNLVDWKLTPNTKKILNYQCQEAIGHFRGRDYKVYFTTELPFKTAPLKFFGTPGVVLAINSLDKKIKIKATNITVKNNKESNTLKNPYKNKDVITWDKFVKIYQKKEKEFLEKISNVYAKLGKTTDGIRDPRVEIITERNR